MSVLPDRSPHFNPHPPPRDPVRLSAALRLAVIDYRHQSRQLYKDMAAAMGISPSLLSQFLHGKVVGKGDPRLAAIGQYMQRVAMAAFTEYVPAEEWEEPA